MREKKFRFYINKTTSNRLNKRFITMDDICDDFEQLILLFQQHFDYSLEWHVKEGLFYDQNGFSELGLERIEHEFMTDLGDGELAIAHPRADRETHWTHINLLHYSARYR